MSLTVNATRDCKFISSIINYVDTSATYPLTLELSFTDIDGNSLISTNPTVTLSSSGVVTTVVTPVDNLSISNGVINVELLDPSVSPPTVLSSYPILLHCDIDCCLAKLTNELIDCACDCAKCSSVLAKAQKIFLLIQSADYALSQVHISSSGTISGALLDAHNKYTKAKEICDDSCGCDC